MSDVSRLDNNMDDYFEQAEAFQRLIGKTFSELIEMRKKLMVMDIMPNQLLIPRFKILGMEVEFHDGPVEVRRNR